MTPERIVVGIDFSESSMAAARWTAARFGESAELMLVNAVDIPAPPAFLRSMLPPREELVETARRGAELRLREFGGTLLAGRIWTEVRPGRPAEVLQAIVTEYDAGLVVVGEHGRRRGMLDLLGSTAEQVVRESTVPVLVGRELPADGPGWILVPVPGSELESAVLGWARRFASMFDSRVTALFVLNPMLYGRLHLVATGGESETEAGAEAGASEWLRERLGRAGFAEGEAEAVVAWGDPGHEILAAADRYGSEMVVMGSRDTRTPGRGLMGTVTRAVLRGARVPVLVVPGAAEAPE